MAPPNLSESCQPIQIIPSKNVNKPGYQPYVEPIRISKEKSTVPQEKGPKREIVWRNALIFVILHAITLYGTWLMISLQTKWQTFLFSYLYLSFASTGVTGGAHRLWAHRSYKAKLPFRIWLMIWQTAALQNDIYEWVRDHRAHHKFTDTDADPHNSNRGFFFCHIGWLMTKKHKDVITKGKTIDMSDVESDPVVRWQKRHYIPMVLLMTFILPTYIPIYFWNEVPSISFIVCVTRYVLQLNGTWAVNSAAHLWGYRSYDGSINPRENVYVSTFGYGEGWHNYHHTFPWDYKAAELGNYRMNFTTALLDLMASIGQAYDLKTVSNEIIRKRVNRTGDGTWVDPENKNSENSGDKEAEDNSNKEFVWGWDDKDMKEEDIKGATIYHTLKEE